MSKWSTQLVLLLMMSCINVLMHGGSNCLDCRELVWLWFYRALRGLLLSSLQVLGVKKGKAFLSKYVKVLEFQSSPNWGLGLLD